MAQVQTGSLDGEKSVGLNSSELEDLSQVTSPSGDSSFTETPISGETMRTSAPRENVDMLLDVELDVSIELGRTNLSIKRILEMGPGSIVELDRMAGEPVDLLVNSKVVAKGEVVVVDENFGIRIVSLVRLRNEYAACGNPWKTLAGTLQRPAGTQRAFHQTGECVRTMTKPALCIIASCMLMFPATISLAQSRPDIGTFDIEKVRKDVGGDSSGISADSPRTSTKPVSAKVPETGLSFFCELPSIWRSR